MEAIVTVIDRASGIPDTSAGSPPALYWRGNLRRRSLRKAKEWNQRVIDGFRNSPGCVLVNVITRSHSGSVSEDGLCPMDHRWDELGLYCDLSEEVPGGNKPHEVTSNEFLKRIRSESLRVPA